MRAHKTIFVFRHAKWPRWWYEEIGYHRVLRCKAPGAIICVGGSWDDSTRGQHSEGGAASPWTRPSSMLEHSTWIMNINRSGWPNIAIVKTVFWSEIGFRCVYFPYIFMNYQTSQSDGYSNFIWSQKLLVIFIVFIALWCSAKMLLCQNQLIK